MSTFMAGSPGAHANGSTLQIGAQFLISVPDSERLLLQSRFVRNQLEAEILNELEARIRSARVLDPSAVPADLVTMNSQVLLRDVDSGRQLIFTLVFPARADARKGRVSILTPLGSLLLGARTGQRLTCPISGAVTTVLVEAILHQPEAAGDYYG
jgi:regulator of nucleoside diphosphate kinase